MHAVRENGEDRDGVDEDDLDEGVSGRDSGVDVGGVGHSLQSVQGYGCQTQCGDVNRSSLEILENML